MAPGSIKNDDVVCARDPIFKSTDITLGAHAPLSEVHFPSVRVDNPLQLVINGSPAGAKMVH